MNNRDPVVEVNPILYFKEKQGFLSGALGAFAQTTEAIVNSTMEEVNKVVQAGQPKPSLGELIANTQTSQQNFIIMLIIQFALALFVIGIFLFAQISHVLQKVAFILWALLLIMYILTMVMAQFSGKTMQKNPQNVFLFSLNSILRILWMSYLVVVVQFFSFELVVLLLLIDLIIILIFLKIDQSQKINNCFLISKQLWRITIIALCQLLFVGLLLRIQDFITAFIWLFIICGSYCFLLLEIQLIEWREFMKNEGNAWFLAAAIFDSDIIFPCFFIQCHCTCYENGNVTIMRD